jgi:hypothetical protein
MTNYRNEMSIEDIRHFAPSAFATEPYHAQSGRYTFIPTSDVISGLREAGFVPVSASQSRTRIADKKDFTKHMLRFRSLQSFNTLAVVGESIVEVVLINAHDGTSRYKLMGGVFRFVCSNGMVVADSLLAAVSIRHTGNIIDEVIAGTQHVFEQAPKILDVIGKWQSVELSTNEQLALATSAHRLRFEEKEGEKQTGITPEMLLAPRRRDDAGNSLWNTFNRIQENTTKGIRTFSNGERVTSRAVKSISNDVRLNRALWTRAEAMAELKGLL